jgi:large subunit ribosomal protein L5
MSKIEAMAARLKQRYQKDIAPAIAKEFGIKNPMAIPRLEKIVLNMGMARRLPIRKCSTRPSRN